MARNNETTTDQDFEDMKNLAVEQQQCFYELLCDCMTYELDEHKYLKQNIGYALYGPPNTGENATNSNVYCNTENQSEDADITDAIVYKNTTIIDKIYEKIYEYTVKVNADKPIYFAIIYNIVVCPKLKEEDTNFVVIPIPIFKIWRSKKTDTTKKEKAATNLIKTDEIYIDTSGRVYKDWADYKTTNNLFKCIKNLITNLKTDEIYIWYIDTSGRVYKDYKINLFKCIMVLPKDGLYQADPSCPITEDYSTVWLEIMESPAYLFNKGNTIFGTMAFAAKWFAPKLAPIFGFETGTQYEIPLLDQEAFPQWLTITGSMFGLGVMEGTAAISAAVSRGMTVNTAARLAFNTVQDSNLFLNGVGIIYQYYCISRYRTDETFSFLDAVNLATHLMFFTGTVVNIQLTGDVIKNNQSKIFNDYRETVRTKQLRKQFNRVKRRAAANNSCPMTEKAEVICYIRHRNRLISKTSADPATSATPVTSGFNRATDNTNSRMITWAIKRGILVINDITLLDAQLFVVELIQSDRTIINSNPSNISSSQNIEDDFRTTQLWSILNNLLENFFSPGRNEDTTEFIPLLREMDSLNVNKNLLKKLFNIALRLIMQHFRAPAEFLFKAFKFVWLYCKRNLRQWGINTCLRMQSIAGSRILHMIITALFEAVNFDNLYVAFEIYLTSCRVTTN
ncbi:uncharacterized protein LOC116846092 [Odontomachus brunneus]|uniref:uncharacterized protein LOC116846092 n=1 Tax=Odontomachus brunneus TaxID=486640 RepID=UPI0013F1ED48|nr:uncharacterized protein LOC116846092 [Odontomachus brunneus]XP_032675402.1 uncharacterized protein LOC116846092 [Odontomachus brunneus]XP_032675403.1 uncharacterized protein LOC116846092 [Odontomachus brunneus]XP_032675405.1 uncharacterized protein LOC116846092 [Odontomachus brunneus]XP_032675406.1 uncharacterized protein LOC116846092 [Odontomachus brunneus]